MKTNWREIRQSLSTNPAFGTFNPFSRRGLGEEESHSDKEPTVVRSVDSAESPERATNQSDDPKAKSVKSSESREGDITEREAIQAESADAELHHRLTELGISIAVDKRTSSAYLVFSCADAETVHSVADVYPPEAIFEIHLTRSQQRELLDSVNYYEDLMQRKRAGGFES